MTDSSSATPAFIPLSRPYAARAGVPVIDRVDARIFTHRYFGACMACGFCRDACCNHGVDVDLTTMRAILASADELEPLVGAPRAEWFSREVEEDGEMPGGASVRTEVRDGMCVFRSRSGRGCVLHAYALSEGRDYHEIKPIVSALFPVTFGGGELLISEELEDGSLVCVGGPVAYESVRGELLYYFGEEMVAEMDAMRLHH